jgi:hypothetical protein
MPAAPMAPRPAAAPSHAAPGHAAPSNVAPKQVPPAPAVSPGTNSAPHHAHPATPIHGSGSGSSGT